MSSNPIGTSRGNYSAPIPDFSRYTGPSFQPPNFYPPNPSIPLTNPYPGSSIGAYPNATFPWAWLPLFSPLTHLQVSQALFHLLAFPVIHDLLLHLILIHPRGDLTGSTLRLRLQV